MIGTLQLLAACERTETLRTVVVRGSAAIYGCEGAAPSFFTEDLARATPLRTRFQRDISELEEYFDNFARRHPELTCCMLRFQPEIGAGLASPLVRYLTPPGRSRSSSASTRGCSCCDAEDATAALVAAVDNPVRGPVNVAPDGAISLSRVLRLLRRPAVPLPGPAFDALMRRFGGRLGAGGLLGDGVRLLRYGRGVDNRRLRERAPAIDAARAIRGWPRRRARRVGHLHPGTLAAARAVSR